MELITKKIDGVTVNYAKNPSQGDITTNAALVLGKFTKRDPSEVAPILIRRIQNIEGIKLIEVAGGGFINIKIEDSIWLEELNQINELKSAYGSTSDHRDEKINVEFVSANPTGPLHVGNARGAITFDVLSSLFSKVGYSVTREYYINDSGSQIAKLVDSVFLKYSQELGETIEKSSQSKSLYNGTYISFIAKKLVDQYKNKLKNIDESERYKVISKFAIDSVMKMIIRDIKNLGVRYDVFRSESDVCKSGALDKCIEILTQKKLIQKTVLEQPKGKKAENWEQKERLVFLSKKYGDAEDRSLQRANGDWSYFAGDLAYHYDKINRGFNKMVVGLGSDHSGYVKRLKSAVSALAEDKAEIEVRLYNIVRFINKGKASKMSKRSNNFLTISQVIRTVGIDAVRFMMLMRKSDAPLDFDLELLKQKSNSNPVFYVQYAHARSKSIIKSAPQDLLDQKEYSYLLTNESELSLIKKLVKWPEVIRSAVQFYEPHRVTFYLLEVAEFFHSLWNLGKQNSSLRFIIESQPQLTAARISLVKATAHIIASGLEVLGIKPANEM